MVKKIVLWAMVIFIMTAIFIFSSEPAVDSDDTSRGFTYTVLSISERFRALSEEEQFEIVEACQHMVRKTAHFSIYLLLGFLLFMALWASGLRFFFAAPLIAAFYAAADELHQIFVAGRSGEIRDVLIDFTGALCGAFLALLITKVVLNLRRKADG